MGSTHQYPRSKVVWPARLHGRLCKEVMAKRKIKKAELKDLPPCTICEDGYVDDPAGYEKDEDAQCHECSGTGKKLPKWVKRCEFCFRINGKHYDFCSSKKRI